MNCLYSLFYNSVCASVFFFLLAVHAKSIVAILHLLVALSQHFRAPIRLPDHVSIQVVVVQVGVTRCLCMMDSFVRLSVMSGTLPCFNFLEKRGHPPVPTNWRGNHRQHGVSVPSIHCPFFMLFRLLRWASVQPNAYFSYYIHVI